MRIQSTVLLLFSLMALEASAQPPGDLNGVIAGRVINEAGEYVAGAKVRAEPAGAEHRGGFVRYVETDKEGNFELEHLAWGLYYVFAMKEADGYADTYWSIYDDGVLTQCEVAARAPKATILVTIGPKAGLIVGSIANSVTGAPIQNGSIRIWRWDNATAFMDASTAPEYRKLVPANIAVGLKIYAPGFEAWYHASDATPGEPGPLLLKPGAKLRIDIKLRPLQ